MKKKNIIIGSICLVAVIMGACGTQDKKNMQDNIQAMENSSHKSADTTDASDSKKYEKYETYGLKYNNEEKRFYYEGKLVRKFSDKKDASGNTEGFSFSDGEIDIEAQRSKTYKLEGLKVLTKEEFDKNTEKLKETIILNGVQSFEAGDDKVKDDTLEDYSLYGVIYDSERELWRYEDKDIYIFYDQDGYKLIQGDVNIKNSVSLKVERNQDGKIEKLVKLNENEVASYTKEIIQ